MTAASRTPGSAVRGAIHIVGPVIGVTGMRAGGLRMGGMVEHILAGGPGAPDQRDEQPLEAWKAPPDTGQHHRRQRRDRRPDRNPLFPAKNDQERCQHMADHNQRRPSRTVIGADMREILAA